MHAHNTYSHTHAHTITHVYRDTQGRVGAHYTCVLFSYGVTRMLNHLGFVVLPLLTLALGLVKVVPLVLRIYGSARLTGFMKQLEAVEKAHASGADPSKLLAELKRLDEKSAKIFVPRSKVHDYIDFRQFLHDMRERVSSRGS